MRIFEQLLVVGALVLTTGLATAQDMTWRGRFTCEAAPSVNLGASASEALVRREGNIIVFSRTIRSPDSAQSLGQEAGTATLNGNAFTIDTSSTMGRASISGRYQGTIAGETVTLAGKQTMLLGQRGNAERACQARLSSRPG